MNESVKSVIDRRLAGLAVSDKLRNNILDTQPPVRKGSRKLVAVALAASLCLLLSITAMAALIPGFNLLLSQVSPEIARFLRPVESANIDNGLRVEVVGAMRDDDIVIVYLTIQDLTGDRIGTRTVIDDYSIPGGYITNQEGVSYDEETKTTTLRLTVNDVGGMDDGEIALRISSFDPKKENTMIYYTGVDLEEIPSAVHTQPLRLMGFDGEFYNQYEENGIVDILTPEMHIPISSVDNAYISNIGIVNGRLHVQVNYQCTSPWDDDCWRGYVSLTNAPVEKLGVDYFSILNDYDFVDSIEWVHFAVDENGDLYEFFYADDSSGIPNGYITHIEFVFDISLLKNGLPGYNLIFWGEDSIIKGDWQANFEIEPERLSAARCDISIENVHIDSFAVSPFQMIISGSGRVSSEAVFEILVTMKAGETMKYGAVLSRNSEGEVHISGIDWTIGLDGKHVNEGYSSIKGFSLDTRDGNNDMAEVRLMPALPIDFGNVAQISINGNVIEFDTP